MSIENKKSFLRWGGLVGILAFIVWIVNLPIYGYVDPFVPEGLMRFPDLRVGLAVNTILCMTIAFLSVTFVLVLYRVLREVSQTLALLGCVLGVIGYVATAFGDASTFLAFAPISDLYHAATTNEAQATFALLWQATRGITNTFFFIGILFMMLGFIVLGMAMLRARAPTIEEIIKNTPDDWREYYPLGYLGEPHLGDPRKGEFHIQFSRDLAKAIAK